jgi:hypothetical protein
VTSSIGDVVLSQRLRTTALAAVLALAVALFVNVAVLMVNTTNGHGVPVLEAIIFVAVLVVLVGLLVLALRVEVRVVQQARGRALEVVYGPGPLVRQRFGPERILSTAAIDLSATQTGGWGYRGSLKLIRRASLVTRRGAALELNLSGQRRFVVTVDDPEAFRKSLQTGFDPTP